MQVLDVMANAIPANPTDGGSLGKVKLSSVDMVDLNAEKTVFFPFLTQSLSFSVDNFVTV